MGEIYYIGGKGMKKFRKVFFLTFLLVASVTIFLACSKEQSTDPDTRQETETQVTIAPTQESEPTEATAADTPDDAAGTTATAGNTDPTANWSEDMKEMRDISSVDLVKEIKIGWNLGNTMDANGADTVMAETSWGNPKTTKELIDAVKTAGFNILRIPTTWESHLGPAPDYTIDPAWLDRVQEIVEYGISNDMFIIVNAHHEEWYFPSYENADTAKDMLAKVWKQIADRFENYDEHLIFEGLNEPRQKGTNDEWNGGNAEGWDVVNQLNAVFVDIIRSSAGNNPIRHLMVTPYAASSSTRAWDTFIVPDDDKVIVSIHAYTPYNFALNKQGTADWSASNVNDTKDIDNLMISINNKFLSNGIPVILGEFGAMNKNDNVEDRAAWAEYYVSKAQEKGIPCIWWDNGAFYGSGELFGLIDRFFYIWKSPEIIEAMMKVVQ